MISFEDLKNYIINDPLSDWFTKINEKYNAYEMTEPTSFEEKIRKNKYLYKENFIEFLMNTNYQINIDLHMELKQRFSCQ